MVDPYILVDNRFGARTVIGEVTTIRTPGGHGFTLRDFFSKAQFTAIKSALESLQKNAASTLSAVMNNRPLTDIDKAALKAAGLGADEALLQCARTIKEAVDGLKGGPPEVFLRGAGGKPVTQATISAVTNDLRGVVKSLSSEAAEELRSVLAEGGKEIHSKEL